MTRRTLLIGYQLLVASICPDGRAICQRPLVSAGVRLNEDAVLNLSLR